jgi:transcriptional regulator with XRE-family HTH domain
VTEVKLSFHERFAEALRRRLFPRADIHLKQIAAAIGVSENSIGRWWRGESRIFASDVDRIAKFFARRGDYAFLGEVFADTLRNKNSDTDREDKFVELLRSALARLDVGPDANFWVKGDGSLEPAPFGHAEYVARDLRMPLDSGDLIRYANGILGWIAVTVRQDGAVTVRHDARRIAPLAAEHFCEWLSRRRNSTPVVMRSIQIEDRSVEARHDTVDLALEAVARAAFIVRNPRRLWNMKRLPLDRISDETLSTLLRVHYESPDQVIHSAAEIGAFTSSSVLAVDGDNVTSLYVPTQYSISRQSVEGKNVLSRADTDYALMIHDRILLTKRQGPTYYELSGSVNNEFLHYFSLAIPEPGPHGKVLTTSVILKLEPLVA